MNIVSGARLSSGGLHLGHYLGCFQKLKYMSEKYDELNYFFLIADRDIMFNKPEKAINIQLFDMLLDIYAIKNTLNIKNFHVGFESVLLEKSDSIKNLVHKSTTYSQLINANPKCKSIKKNNTSIKIGDFLFPLDETVTALALKADLFFLNDDNIRFATYCNKISKKLNMMLEKEIFPEPKLVSGNLPRLLGYNYEKVSKGNKNAIFLSEDDETIRSKVDKLFNLKYFFKKFPKERVAFESAMGNYTYRYPESYLPFQYIKAFDSKNRYKEIINSSYYRNPKNRSALYEIIYDIVLDIIAPIREERNKLQGDKYELIHSLKEDINITSNYVNETCECMKTYYIHDVQQYLSRLEKYD